MMAMNALSSEIEHTAVRVPVGQIRLAADLALPPQAIGLVLFAHGSGSSRKSPRNRHVAGIFNEAEIATLLIDLLTEEEEAIDVQTAGLRFDIALLAGRLAGITDWIQTQPRLKVLGLGYFGASTGAGAALVAAAERPNLIRAIVSRGGRPDLAGEALARIVAPTLCIVGSRDPVVMDLNYAALERFPHETKHKLQIVRGASHLFEEVGTLDQVAIHARDWFREYLPANPVSRA